MCTGSKFKTGISVSHSFTSDEEVAKVKKQKQYCFCFM